MKLDVAFEKSKQVFEAGFSENELAFTPDVGEVINLSDGEKQIAYQTGYDEGHTEGHAKGYESGHADGYAKGYGEGETAGYETGHAEAVEANTTLDEILTRDISGDYCNDRVTSIGAYAFINCRSLGDVLFPKVTSISNLGFQSCTSMKKADFPMCKSISASGFAYCSGLKALILRRTDDVVKLGNANVFNESSVKKGTGYVYVPAALVDQYKNATNWTTYAAQIRAIEDYPEITG